MDRRVCSLSDALSTASRLHNDCRICVAASPLTSSLNAGAQDAIVGDARGLSVWG
ncbi:hypothetical protein [Paraburkholderia flava]|uniref:hypothetical protein n=1 Tax=Paraburkholderia flava TaxID=2547393 RepID=UPI001415216F|nr:hypothetical protein [Paraburkholderia flava]